MDMNNLNIWIYECLYISYMNTHIYIYKYTYMNTHIDIYKYTYMNI